MALANAIAGGEEVVQGSFEITDEVTEFSVTGLGFTPTSVIVCEDEFGEVKKRTCGWIRTDILSMHLRYNADTSILPSISGQSADNNNTFISILDDGFTIKQSNAKSPIVAKKYNYIAW